MYQYLIPLSLLLVFTGCTPQSGLSPSEPQKPCINAQQLNTYGYDHLERVAKQLREERKNIDSFDVVMVVMKRTMDEYSDMLKSSIAISNVARFLPIPYAGEVCNTTKLISKMALNLGNTATALHQYKASSGQFLEGFDKLNRASVTSAEIAKLSQFADTKLLADAKTLEFSLKEISASTTSLAATTQSISEALDTTSGYMTQAKSLVGFSGDANVDEKKKVAQNRTTIHERLTQLNQKLATLEKSGQVYRYNIAKARVYSDLALSLEQAKR